MTLVLFNWLCWGLVFWWLGTAVAGYFLRTSKLEFALRVVIGMIVSVLTLSVTVLFLPVHPWGIVGVGVVLIGCVAVGWRHLLPVLVFDIKYIRANIWWAVPSMLWIAIAAARFSVYPPTHYDEGLYYTPFIKWLHEYGIVVGIGNLQDRFGFNSNWLLLCSLINKVPGQSIPYNDLNGLMGMVLVVRALTALRQLFGGSFSPGLLFRVGGLYSVGLLSGYFDGTAPDFGALAMAWLACDVSLSDEFDREETRAWILAALVMFAITIKISSAPLILLLVVAAVRCGEWRVWIRHSLNWGIPLIGLWMVRTVIISGYLVYPIRATALPVDWLVPLEAARMQVAYIKLYAVDPKIPIEQFMSMSMWSQLEHWWAVLSEAHRFLVTLTAACLGVVWVWITVRSFYFRRNPILEPGFAIAVFATFGLIYWLLSAPAVRFGLGSMYVAIGLCGVLLAQHLPKALRWIAIVICLFYSFQLWRGGYRGHNGHLWAQQEYPKANTRTERVGSITFTRVVTGDQCWDAELPSVADYLITPSLRGKRIEDGFRAPQ